MVSSRVIAASKPEHTRPPSPSKKSDRMPECTLCGTAFFGRGNVCAPLGRAGDRCCDGCNATLVVPARFESISKRTSPYTEDDDDTIRTSKRQKTSEDDVDWALPTPSSPPPSQDNSFEEEDNVPPHEEDLHPPCDPGIEVESSVVPHGLRSVSVAVKPPLPVQRLENMAIDVIVGCDATGSMCGPGEEGLRCTIQNFDVLVEKSLKKHFGHGDEDKDKVDAVRRSTSMHFFSFGERSRAFKAPNDGFVSLDSNMKEFCTAVSAQLEFGDGYTDISSATAYATAAAKTRIANKAVEDRTTGTKRIVCFVLLTDGSVNKGLRRASDMISTMDNELSDVYKFPMSVFAIGLGAHTDPSFLTNLCRGGYWKHVTDAYDPSQAFEVAFGTIISCVDTYSVSMRIGIERDGEALAVPNVVVSKYVGLLTPESCRARKIKVSLPRDAQPGDELVIKTAFGLSGDEIESRIFVGVDRSECTSGIHTPTTKNMVSGLYAEAEDIENAIEELKAKISSGEDLNSTTNGLIQANSASYAVRAQLQRFSTILESSLSQSTAGSSIGTAYLPYSSSYSPSHPSSYSSYSPPYSPLHVSYTPSYVPYASLSAPVYEPHSVTSSFSQIDA